MSLKACTKCLTEKPVEDFTADVRYKGGRKHQCRACCAAYHRDYYASSPEYRAKVAASGKINGLKTRYNLTPEARAEMEQAQGGLCAICQQPGPLVVDHDHATGKVRALLHRTCNQALGLLKDDPRRARVAAAYLEQHRKAA